MLHPGDILLAEDIAGTGHSWKLVDENPWRRAYVILGRGAEVPFVANPPVQPDLLGQWSLSASGAASAAPAKCGSRTRLKPRRSSPARAMSRSGGATLFGPLETRQRPRRS
jgi:hypothetical protein